MATELNDGSRVLLTGATGLIGHWVRAHWPVDGPTLICVGSGDGDLLRPGNPRRLVEQVRPTHLVHLAWSASSTPGYRESGDNAAWLTASLELYEAARDRGAAVWLTGTVVDDVSDAADEYTLSKLRLRDRLTADIEAGRLGWLRPAYVFDEARGRPGLLAQAIEAQRRGEPVQVRTPYALHDFVHASDVGSAAVLAVLGGHTGYLAVGSGQVRPVHDLLDALGLEWTHVDGAEPVVAAHAATALDMEWLQDTGWQPTRTKELFRA